MIIVDRNKKIVTIYVGDREIELDLDDFEELKREIIYISTHTPKEIIDPPRPC